MGQESSVIQALSAATDSNATRGRPRDREQIRKAIIDAARRVAAREGTANFSLSLVADEARFAPGTVYGYFRTKGELLLSVFAEDLTSVAGAMRDMAQMESAEAQSADEVLQSDQSAAANDFISSSQAAGDVQSPARAALTDSLIFIAQHAGSGALRPVSQEHSSDANVDFARTPEQGRIDSALLEAMHPATSENPEDVVETKDDRGSTQEAIETPPPIHSEAQPSEAFSDRTSSEYYETSDSDDSGSEERPGIEDEPSADFIPGNFGHASPPAFEEASITTPFLQQPQSDELERATPFSGYYAEQSTFDRQTTTPTKNASEKDDNGLSTNEKKRLERAQLDTIIDRLVVPQGQAPGNSGAVARLERRIGVFEHELAELLGQQSELKQTSAQIDTRVDALAGRFETSEQRQRETVAELRGQILDISTRVATTRLARDVRQPDDASAQIHLEERAESSLAVDTIPSPEDKIGFEPLPKDTNSVSTMGETFLTAARRSASAAMVTESGDQQQPKSETMRYVLLGGAALVVLILLGFAFNHKSTNTGGAVQQKQPIALHTRKPIQRVVALHPVVPKMVVPATAESQSSTVQPIVGPVPTAPKVAGQPTTTSPKPLPATGNVDLGALPNVPASAERAAHHDTGAPLDRLTALAQSGNAKAELVVGLKYLEGEGVAVNKTQAARWIQRAAAKAHPVAQYRLGTLYQHGLGVPRDVSRAMHWYQAAADHGNTKAMYNLAFGYAEGWSGGKDYAQAARWFSSAARLGYVDAQFNLAVLYERGAGVPQSLLDAYKWYSIAEQQGDKDAKIRVEAISTQLSAPELSAAQQAATAFRPARANYSANSTPVLAALLASHK